MPIVYEYLGIKIGFYSNEHEPIHVHATYGGAMVKVSLFVRNNVVYKVTYKEEQGTFNRAKFADLKTFISVNKNALLYAWLQFFQNNYAGKNKINTIIITKKIK